MVPMQNDLDAQSAGANGRPQTHTFSKGPVQENKFRCWLTQPLTPCRASVRRALGRGRSGAGHDLLHGIGICKGARSEGGRVEWEYYAICFGVAKPTWRVCSEHLLAVWVTGEIGEMQVGQ